MHINSALVKRVYSESLLLQPSFLPYHRQVGILYGSRFRRDPRQLDEDEEAWFDDEEETTCTKDNLTSSPDSDRLPTITSTTPTKTTPSPYPFTLSSYSPRPPGALTRLPLVETKPPPISAVSRALLLSGVVSSVQSTEGFA